MKTLHRSTCQGRSYQRGASLIELTLVVVILGVVGVLAARWYSTTKAEKAVVASRSSIQRATDALVAFAAIENRLPCPASDNTGVEDCAGTEVGSLPWRTLGLPDRRAMSMNYAVMRRANTADPTLDADLAVARDRTRPMNVIKAGRSVVAIPSATGHVNGLDFCQALRVSMRLPYNSGHLHTSKGNLAFALANQSAALALPHTQRQDAAFPAANTPISPEQTQNIVTMGPEQLWSKLSCAPAMASVNYGHYNVAATANMQYQTVLDLEEQLRVLAKMGDANVSAAEAAVAQAAAGVLGSTTETLQTAADMLKNISSAETKGADMVMDMIGTGLAIAATTLSGANVITANLFLSSVKNTRDGAKANYDAIRHETTGATIRSKLMAECLRASAIAADARGMNPSNPVDLPNIPDCMPR